MGGVCTQYLDALCILVNLSEALGKSENNSDWEVSRRDKERNKAQYIFQRIISVNCPTIRLKSSSTQKKVLRYFGNC